MAKFGDAERNIANLFQLGTCFTLDSITYSVVKVGKPTCKKGEPKTDIYVLAKSDALVEREIKISFKKENADFIENKTNAERAEALFGFNWSQIIQAATASIKPAFENKKLIYKVKGGKTEEGAMTLGWKYELLNKTGGELSGVVKLTRDQIIDVYAGTHLPDDKRNAMVNGSVIQDSGIANYILINDSVATAQDVIDNLYSIDEYVDKYPTVYFACKALNYRTYHDKYDGDRPLSVYVDWTVENGKLKSNLVFNNPLNIKGTQVADKLKEALKILEVKTTREITEDMVANPSVIFK
ncbi:hypothetical protein [Anaerotignum sp.]|uniref:hypothetical protein n=1 Tax=Anaerotignum sp. TaxID=2039241 RepID=UPI0028AADD48|nr:hypothetical protein [Anaerotignum sp.]